MANPMLLLIQSMGRDRLPSRLLPGGPEHFYDEGRFQLCWGDGASVTRREAVSGFRINLVAPPFGANEALLTWDGQEGSLAVARPWPGSVTIYLSKDGRAMSSHLRLLVQAGHAIRPMPIFLAPGSRRMLWPGRSGHDTMEIDPSSSTQRPYASLDDAARDLRAALERAVRTLPADAVLLLSGGVDSAAIAAAAPRALRCVTWTTAKAAPSSTADSDLSAARRVAAHLGLQHETLMLSAAQLQANVEPAVLLGEVRRGTLVDDLVVYVEVARALRRQGVRIVVIGEAADDALGCLPSTLRFFQGPELLRKLRRDYELGMTADHAAISKVFGAFGIDVLDPYLSAPVAEISRRLPLDMRVDAARLMKPVLRQAFQDALPDSVAERPKRVSRDVSGVRALMEERFGRSRERFLPIFDAFFRTGDAVARQREILDGLARGQSGGG